MSNGNPPAGIPQRQYRVLRGIHSEHGKVYKRGQKFTTACNLDRFNITGVAPKFELLSGPAAAIIDHIVPQPADAERQANIYRSMTVLQLRSLADDREIDLGDAVRKDDIVALLIDSLVHNV